MTPGPGHNGGPSLDEGTAWRRHCWTRARTDLLPTLPVEVVRLRVARARELGLPYRTYAGLRASTGRDLIGFLFSSNALRLLRATDPLPEDRHARLMALVACDRVGLAQPPLAPSALLARAPLDAAQAAPPALASWPALRNDLKALLRTRRLPGDAVLLVADTALERDWVAAGGLAGVLAGDAYFAPQP
ncbi:hypothetical protein FHG71_11440 [Rubellimicrobium roseum]|uniref:Uncharacterized protein n=1 Tax=Rubellimicrobium roseum TaxID=687525 RepID=A0A5C4NGG8_9RHOB|nr:hypothetical protein [Rubellimicrobium roseum]TNC71559.1 hypothetical protein FHG71_11440 [Rubellimicrobium roseum]